MGNDRLLGLSVWGQGGEANGDIFIAQNCKIKFRKIPLAHFQQPAIAYCMGVLPGIHTDSDGLMLIGFWSTMSEIIGKHRLSQNSAFPECSRHSLVCVRCGVSPASTPIFIVPYPRVSQLACHALVAAFLVPTCPRAYTSSVSPNSAFPTRCIIRLPPRFLLSEYAYIAAAPRRSCCVTLLLHFSWRFLPEDNKSSSAQHVRPRGHLRATEESWAAASRRPRDAVMPLFPCAR